MIRKAWNLDNTPAPPPAWRSRPTAPIARQTHGNILTWESGASQLENRQEAEQRGRHQQSFERKNALQHSQADLLTWNNAPPPPPPAEGRANLINNNTANVFAWSAGADAPATVRRVM